MPVTRGMPFEIKLDALAGGTFDSSVGDGSGSGVAEITLSAFDSSGAPVNILAPILTPEPSTFGLSALALLGTGLLLRWRKG